MTVSNQTVDHLKFYKSVEKTDPKFAKQFTVNKQTRTAVCAQYKKKMITQSFGMYGTGWGIVPSSEKFERVHYENSTCLLVYTATAFYAYEGQRGEMPLAASIREAYVTNAGKGYLLVDDEAVKKVRTDALTKAFTDLGFSADIHLGLFDDQDYVKGAQMDADIKNAEEKEIEARKKYDEVKAYVEEQIEAIKKVSHPAQAIKAYDRVIAKVQTRCQAAGFTSKGFETNLNTEKDKLNAK